MSINYVLNFLSMSLWKPDNVINLRKVYDKSTFSDSCHFTTVQYSVKFQEFNIKIKFNTISRHIYNIFQFYKIERKDVRIFIQIILKNKF